MAPRPREGLHALLGGFVPLAQHGVAQPWVSGRARNVTRGLRQADDGISFELGGVRFAVRDGGAPVFGLIPTCAKAGQPHLRGKSTETRVAVLWYARHASVSLLAGRLEFDDEQRPGRRRVRKPHDGTGGCALFEFKDDRLTTMKPVLRRPLADLAGPAVRNGRDDECRQELRVGETETNRKTGHHMRWRRREKKERQCRHSFFGTLQPYSCSITC